MELEKQSTEEKKTEEKTVLPDTSKKDEQNNEAEQIAKMKERVANLQKKEKLLELKAAGIPEKFAEFLSADVDIKDFIDLFQTSTNGYTPQSHKKSIDGLTKEKFKSLSYSERAKLYEESPDLIKKFL